MYLGQIYSDYFLCALIDVYHVIKCTMQVLYSRNISRAPIFKDFEDFLLTSKILSLKFLAAI